jgi:hypothetical protein
VAIRHEHRGQVAQFPGGQPREHTEMTMIGSFALWYLTCRALTHFSTLLKYALDQRIWMKICLRGIEGGFETSRFSDLA